MKYFLYARKSTEDEERQVMSIEAQLEELKQYAKRERITIAETFIESKSAKKPGREIFNRMIASIKSSDEPVGIIAWHPDRLARNSIDGGQIIYLIDENKIVSLRFPTFWFEPTPQGLFMLQVAFGQSKYYSDNLSENVLRGIRQKLRRGEWSTLAPFGYFNNPKTRNIEPDPVKARIIKKAYEEYATGKHTLKSISERFEYWGITNRNGKPLTRSAVQRILTNTAYIGLMIRNGETYEGSFKAIISKELFDKVQRVLQSRSKPRKRKYKNDFPFLGFLTCGECGAAISAQYAKGNGGLYRYYRCTKKLSPCKQPYLREDLFIAQLKEILRGVTLSKYYADKMLARVEEWEKTESFSADSLIEQFDKDIKTTEYKLDKLINTFLDGDIEKEIYLSKKDELIRRKAELSAKKTQILKNGQNWNEPLKEWIIEASSVDKLVSSENYADIKYFLEKIGTNRRLKEKKIEMDFKEPWNLLFFSDDVLKRPLKNTGRSPENFSGEKPESVKWSGWSDLNRRPLRPERSALAKLSHTPTRKVIV